MLSCIRICCAANCVARMTGAVAGLARFASTAIRTALGRISRINSSRLPLSWGAKPDNPVTLPPAAEANSPLDYANANTAKVCARATSCRRSHFRDDLHLEPHELSGKLREPSVALARVTDVEREVLAFDPAGRSQGLAEHLDARGEVLLGAGRKNADSGCPRHGLSAEECGATSMASETRISRRVRKGA